MPAPRPQMPMPNPNEYLRAPVLSLNEVHGAGLALLEFDIPPFIDLTTMEWFRFSQGLIEGDDHPRFDESLISTWFGEGSTTSSDLHRLSSARAGTSIFTLWVILA